MTLEHARNYLWAACLFLVTFTRLVADDSQPSFSVEGLYIGRSDGGVDWVARVTNESDFALKCSAVARAYVWANTTSLRRIANDRSTAVISAGQSADVAGVGPADPKSRGENDATARCIRWDNPFDEGATSKSP